MKRYSLLMALVYLGALLINLDISAHGFSAYTIVKSANKYWWAIQQIYDLQYDKEQYVKSYDFNTKSCVKSKVTSAGSSTTNCYFRLGFDEWFNDDVLCTPIQEFWVISKQEWVPAFKLKVGDVLLAADNQKKRITYKEFVKKQLKVYAIEVSGTHNFFVGRHEILTHNISIPAVASLGFIIPFGEGAAAGGALGSYFGPVTVVGGIAIGGIIGLTISRFQDKDKKPHYHLDFAKDAFDRYLHPTYEDLVKEANKENDGKDNSKEQNGNKPDQRPKPGEYGKPGAPTAAEGFKPPKNWDGKKRPHPLTGQWGYPDKSGNIWVPANDHAGPHWDVVDKHGNHDNVNPGGSVRRGSKR